MRRPALTRRLTLETRERLPDGAGGFVESWAATGALWAEIRPGSGRAAAGPGGPLSLARHRIVLRAAPQAAPSRPRPGQRLRDGARLFLIRAVTEADPAGRYLILWADEETAQ